MDLIVSFLLLFLANQESAGEVLSLHSGPQVILLFSLYISYMDLSTHSYSKRLLKILSV